jgi:transposase
MSPRRYELSDFEWSIIEPLLPNKPRGVPRADDRKVLNGIYWRLRTGSPRGRHPGTVWSGDGRSGCSTSSPVAEAGRLGSHFRRCFSRLRWRPANDRLLVDPCPPACRQREAGRRDQKGGLAETNASLGNQPHARCMGRSRGGLTTKIHALVDANGLPILLKLTEGQAHDGRSAADMLDDIGEGQILLADRAYDSDSLRRTLTERRAWANVKPMPNRKNIPAFSQFVYRYRNLVERFFSKIKHFRAVATRFEKHDANYLALVKLAAARIWMRFMSR